jgi:hypothetical protein
MFNSITKLFKKDPVEVALNEYRKIVKLKEDLEKIEPKDEIQQEIKETQHKVLKNNFEAVAKTYDLKTRGTGFGYLNLQSTEKRIYKLSNIENIKFSEKTFVEYSPRIIEIDHGLTSKLDFETEKKFMKLKPKKLKTEVFQKIRKRVQEKVKKAVIKLVQDTPYNEDVFYRYIMEDLNDHPVFDIETIEERYDFVYYLLSEFDWDDDYNINVKNILIFNVSKYGNSIKKLIQEIKTKRYDFAVRDVDSIGHKSFRKYVE